MSGAIDVTKTFRGEGEDMIAALIAASGAKPARETTTGGTRNKTRGGDGAAAFDVDGEVVKEKRSFERELVPFDFGDGGGASIAEASGGAVKAAKSVPAPKAAAKSGKMPKPKSQGKKTSNKTLPRPKNDSDQVARANQVFEPQQSTLTPDEKAAMFVDAAPSGGGKKKNKRITDADRAKAATNDQQWANSSFQNAPAADQLPMPSFLKDVAAPSAPRASSPMPPRAPPTPTSAQDLKNLLGVKTNPPPQMRASPAPMPPPTQAKGHALFNNILNSANTVPGAAPSAPVPAPTTMMPPPQQQGVQQKLNALFGVASQPPQPFPVPQPYPVAPETSGGNFQNLMAKLNAGRV